MVTEEDLTLGSAGSVIKTEQYWGAERKEREDPGQKGAEGQR